MTPRETPSREPARLLRAVPAACLLVSLVTGITALATAVALESYAYDQGWGLYQDSFFALFLAAPFIAMSLMSYFAGTHGAQAARAGHPSSSLRSVRVRVTWMLPILLFGVVASGGRHFDRMGGANAVTVVAVALADSGVPASVLAWLLSIGVVWGARRTLGAGHVAGPHQDQG